MPRLNPGYFGKLGVWVRRPRDSGTTRNGKQSTDACRCSRPSCHGGRSGMSWILDLVFKVQAGLDLRVGRILGMRGTVPQLSLKWDQNYLHHTRLCAVLYMVYHDTKPRTY
jgi:hypothetical protein